MSPNIYIIAGPNGAGKTTFARAFLPKYAVCRNFINADLIAQGISPFLPEAAAFQAGRLVLQEITRFIGKRVDFGFETTLSGKSYLNLFRNAQNQGYKIHLFFLWLPNADLALSRIHTRVLKGGHNVPEADVRRRFDRSISNFMQHYSPLADSWFIFDSSEGEPSIIALEKEGALRIIREDLYRTLPAYRNKDG